MLKIAREEEERRGGALMAWWDGDGAAKVLARHGEALLLERATGARSLTEMVATGRDDEASRILCDVALRLHAPRPGPPPELVPLTRWFEALAPAARTHGGLLARADSAAQALLADPRDVVVLHGDIHHGNVLDGGDRGWLAIDPKGLSASGRSTSSTSCAILTPRRRWRRAASTVRWRCSPLPHRSSGSASSTGRWPSPACRRRGIWPTVRRPISTSRLPPSRLHDDKRRKPCVVSPFPANVPSRP